MRAFEVAKEICETLFQAGYTAYFAGGFVRDHLMGKKSDEIDIATSAPPQLIQELFPKTILVGVAFGVVVVVKDDLHFEVTTFRKDHPYIDGRHPEGVDFSTPEKDAQRRDFTINGMFLDPLTGSIYDYVEGQVDLQKKVVRAIGEPHARFAEDRLRMVRAVRFTSRFQFRLDAATGAAIRACAPDLFPSVSMERIWQELSKMTAHPHFDEAVLLLHTLNLLDVIFPSLKKVSAEEIKARVAPFNHFPLHTPTIVYLLQLFPGASLDEKVALCFYLKTSGEERKIVEFFDASEKLLREKSPAAYAWAHFYAHPLSNLVLHVEAAKRGDPSFLKEHHEREGELQPHIKRIRHKTPLITSSHLAEIGIKPGQQMGILLKAAERLAINENLFLPEDVLRRLQQELP